MDGPRSCATAWLTLLRAGGRRRAGLRRGAELPVTFAGLSTYNVANALAAAAASDALGISPAGSRPGLRSFTLDTAAIPAGSTSTSGAGRWC